MPMPHGFFIKFRRDAGPTAEPGAPLIDTDALRNIAAIAAIMLVVGGYYLLPGLKVFGLDEVNIYHDFTFKLVAEGRWLNYLLHDLLRLVPLPAGSLAFIILAWLFLYLVALDLTAEKRYAAVIASTLILAPPFVEQSLWPLTHLPSVVALLFVSWLARKGASDWLVYIIAGTLLFGMMQNYYFLTPLLLINRFDANQHPLGRIAKQVARHILWWIFGAVSGVLLALAMVYLLTGQAGLAPADWRQATPIESIQDLARNILSVSRYFEARVSTILQSGTGLNFYFFLLCVALLAYRSRAWRPELVRAIILTLVGLSFFAFSVPMAPIIAMRSLVALSTAIILVLLVSYRNAGAPYWLSVFLLLWMGLNLSNESESYFKKHKTETEYALHSILAELPKLPSNYRALAVFGQVDAEAQEAIWFNRGPWTRSIALSAGFPRFWECRKNVPKECAELARKMNIASRTAEQKINFVGVSDNIAVVLFGNPASQGLP